MNDLWVAAVAKSWQAPHVFSSRYYALKGASEEVAKNLPPQTAKRFLKYAFSKYKNESNYAGD